MWFALLLHCLGYHRLAYAGHSITAADQPLLQCCWVAAAMLMRCYYVTCVVAGYIRCGGELSIACCVRKMNLKTIPQKFTNPYTG